MPRRPDIEWDLVAGDDVRGIPHFVPGIEPKGSVVKLSGIGAPNEGNIMRLVRTAEECRGYAAIRRLRRLRQRKIEQLRKEFYCLVYIWAVQVAVIEPCDPHAVRFLAPQLRIARHWSFFRKRHIGE